MSDPKNPAAGVYVNDPSGRTATVPFGGPLTSTAVSGSPSGSVSLASTPGPATTSGVFSSVEYASGADTGGRLAGVTVTVTLPVAVPPLPSEIV